jgi:hypothetical protein
MTLILNGDTGLSDVDGSAATPAIRGTDSNTGIFFPAADTIAFAEGGVEVARINSDAQIVTLAGTASLPALTFTGDLNTGIYSPGADRIGFAEGGVQVGEFDASGNFLMNSGYGSAAVAYGCRAWVNFNGTGTVAIRASGNVTSITDNNTGDYTVNFTTAMPDANYGFNLNGTRSTVGATDSIAFLRDTPTTSGFRINTTSGGGTAVDSLFTTVSVFR